jgi:hypothetical protein
VSERPTTDSRDAGIERAVSLSLDGYAWEALQAEAGAEGVTVEELVTFSVLYYLADIDSGRLARRISLSPHTRVTRSAQEDRAPSPRFRRKSES